MAEIKISIEAIDESILELKTLKETCDGSMPQTPAVIGGGKAVNQIELISNMYKTLNSDLSDLISNTISFLENAEQSYGDSDSFAANKINGN